MNRRESGARAARKRPPASEARELLRHNLRQAFALPDSGRFADLLEQVSEADRKLKRKAVT